MRRALVVLGLVLGCGSGEGPQTSYQFDAGPLTAEEREARGAAYEVLEAEIRTATEVAALEHPEVAVNGYFPEVRAATSGGLDCGDCQGRLREDAIVRRGEAIWQAWCGALRTRPSVAPCDTIRGPATEATCVAPTREWWRGAPTRQRSACLWCPSAARIYHGLRCEAGTEADAVVSD